jgi:hypothetical protein
MMEATEQVDVTNEELAEVHGYAPVHEVEEHEAPRVVLLDADGQLIREAADRLPRRRSERDVRVLLWPQSSLLRVSKKARLSHSALNHQQRRSPNTASRIITRSTMRPIVRRRRFRLSAWPIAS